MILIITIIIVCTLSKFSFPLYQTRHHPSKFYQGYLIVDESLSTPPLNPGHISVLREKDDKVCSEHTYRVGLPSKLSNTMLKYCDEKGITEHFRVLTGCNPLGENQYKDLRLGDLNWCAKRPGSHWNSNMHWISPADAASQDDYLKALSAAGFDEVLQGIGRHFGHIEGLVCYHLTFIAVSYCSDGYMHVDSTGTGNKAFNVIIPLMMVEESSPELQIWSDSRPYSVHSLKYDEYTAVMLGDDAHHRTAACDYRDVSKMRLAATVYLADVTEGNVESILSGYTQKYPPRDASRLLNQAGVHWKRGSSTACLPS